MVAQTRNGKQVMNPGEDAKAQALAEVTGDTVAVVGDNHKLLIFGVAEVPEMARGRGVRLQRYKDGGLADLKIFKAEEGLTWVDAGGRVFTQTIKELAAWRGNRSDAGRVRPDRFLTNNKFGSLPTNGKPKDDK